MRKVVLGLVLLSGLVGGVSGSAQETSTAVPTEPAKISDIVGYNKGFYIQSADENYRLTVSGYLQAQFFAQFIEGATNQDSFRVRRARLKFAGNLIEKALTYELEYDFSTPKMLTAYMQYGFNDSFKVRAGQYHVPFNYEALASSADLQFVDRSIAFAFFGVPDEREFGAGVMGAIIGEEGDKKLEYNLGVFNGEGLNNTNQNNEFRYAGRLVYHVAGKHGYSYSDTGNSEEMQCDIGFGAMYNDTPGLGLTAGAPDVQITSLTPDLSAKYRGGSLHVAYLWQDTQTGAAITDAQDSGWLAQAGYFLQPETLELAGRFAWVMPESAGDQREYTAAVNWFISQGHRFKLQGDYSLLTIDDGIVPGSDQTDHRIRLQVQVKI